MELRRIRHKVSQALYWKKLEIGAKLQQTKVRCGGERRQRCVPGHATPRGCSPSPVEVAEAVACVEAKRLLPRIPPTTDTCRQVPE